MSSIFQGQVGQNTSDKNRKEYEKISSEIASGKGYENQVKRVNVSTIVTDKVPLESGGYVEIHPAWTAATVAYAIDALRANPDYRFIKHFLSKPVIWTYEAKAAFTDGIRIYMSPAFAERLLKAGTKEAKEFEKGLSSMQRMQPESDVKYNFIQSRYIRFVIVHEIYHVFYNHRRRGALKYGHPTPEEHDRANIAMDLEINRDIESTFEDLRGCTQAIDGIWYENEEVFKSDGTMFKKDIWEDIWDDWTEHKKVFHPSNPFNNEDSNPTQKSTAQVGPYADGWRKAIDAIKNNKIDPRTFKI